MAGEGTGGSGGDGGGGSGGGDGGTGPDASAIFDYLNHQNWFSKDGDYTGNAGYYGDNIGPVGSKQPEQAEPPAQALPKTLMAPPRPGRHNVSVWDSASAGGPLMPIGSLHAFAGADVDVYSGLPLDMAQPDPFSGWPAADHFAAAARPPRMHSTAPFTALRSASLLSSPYLLADNSGIVPATNRGAPVPDAKRDFNNSLAASHPGDTASQGATPSADWQDDLKRLAGEQHNGPVLAYINGQFHTIPHYTTTELVVSARDPEQAVLPVPPQQPPPVPDHRYGLYIFKQAAEQASEQSARAFKEGRYFEALVGMGVNALVGSVADLENLMPYNAPDHFLAAGRYAQRWIWYDMRGHSGRGLLELAKGHEQAGAALGGVELALGAAKTLVPSELRLKPALMPDDRGTKIFVERGIVRVQQNTGNAYSYDTKTNVRVVAQTLKEIDASKPGAAIYVGSGGHGTSGGQSFVTEKRLLEPRFYAEDAATVKSLQEIGIGRVLDLSNPVDVQIFKNAERMALEPGQDAVFTIRAWCFSSRTSF
jgi:hypothetical protein